MIRHALASAVAAAALSLPPAASADPVADFYRGKQIKMVLPTAAGGSTSLYGLAVAEFLQRHIPGKPAIVAEYRTGAGGVVATNFSGPRRYGCGTIRDYVIGITAVDGRGVVTMQIEDEGRPIKTDATMQAAGGMYSTVRDLGRWLRAQVSHGGAGPDPVRRDTAQAVLWVGPAFLYLALFIAYPFVMSIYLSVSNARVGSPDKANTRDSTRTTFPSTTASSRPNAMLATARAV